MNDSPSNIDSKTRERFLNIIQENAAVLEVLNTAGKFKLPNWFVGAGCIAQTVWNKFHGFDLNQNITDIDLVYFDDTDLSFEAEDKIIALVKDTFSHFPIDIDVKNQARVHLWYGKHFGYDIEPYISIHDALKSWPTTATSIGIRKEQDNYQVFAPFGLEDLLGMVVRANKVQITEEIYKSKVDRWTRCWPKLKVTPWDES